MPVYNGKKYFETALLSVISAISFGDEIIVVEDGSTDGGVEEIVSKYTSTNPIYYIRKQNGGVATALNVGIENARKPLFSWLSHDDIYLPDRLDSDRVIRTYSPNAITVSDFYLLFEPSKSLRYIPSSSNLSSRQSFRLLSRRFLNGNCLTVPVEVLKSVNGFDARLRHTQDYDLWLRLMESNEFVALPKATVLSRQHELQDSRRESVLAKEEYIRLLKRYLKLSDLLDPRNSFDLLRIIKSLIS
jgi:glycosyltransferase involved in cell wall biosynthesis